MDLWNYDSPLGQLTLAAEGDALTGLWIDGQKYYPQQLTGEYRQTPVLMQAADWLNRYFAGESPSARELKLAPKGCPFRQAVWEILCTIPYGSTTTYAAIAAKIASNRGLNRMSAQAVGGAVGHNPISIIIPCHRVLGSDGSLTGYAGGVDRKQWLLEFEKKELDCI